jgi:hypothetical protein
VQGLRLDVTCPGVCSREKCVVNLTHFSYGGISVELEIELLTWGWVIKICKVEREERYCSQVERMCVEVRQGESICQVTLNTRSISKIGCLLLFEARSRMTS